MRLGCCLVSSDLNPTYIEFYPLVHHVWLKLLGIRAKLALIADAIPPSLEHLADDILLFPPVPGIHTAFQAQCIRLLYPALMERESAGGAVLVSDIDMIPMNRPYYADSIAGMPEDCFAVYRSNVLLDAREIAICYNAARPATWSALFGSVSSIADMRRLLTEWAAGSPDYDGQHGGASWNADQRILFDSVLRWQKQGGNVGLLNDSGTNFRRLDRAEIVHVGGLTTRHMAMIRAGAYSDCHMMRPHGQYRAVNHAIATMLFEAFPKACPSGPSADGLLAASLAVVLSQGRGPVLELGCGPVSTPLIHALCLAQGRCLSSCYGGMEVSDAYPGLRHALHTVEIAVGDLEEAVLASVELTKGWDVVVIADGGVSGAAVERLRASTRIFVLLPGTWQSAALGQIAQEFRYAHKEETSYGELIIFSDTLDVEVMFL